jgi:hypothetical protein
VGQDAEQVAEVGLGIETMEARGGDQREEVAGGLAVVVAADEEPGLAAGRDAAQLALGVVVGELEAAVVEEARERAVLAVGVAERRTQQAALVADARVLDGDPREEGVGVRPQVPLALGLDLGVREIAPGAVEVEDALDAQHGLARDGVLRGDRGLPELATAVAPAADLVADGGVVVLGRRALIRRPEQEVVGALGVDLDVAAEAAKQLADRRRGLARQVLEEDVVRVGDLDEEVRVPAAAAGLVATGEGLDQHAGRVGRDAEGGGERVGVHRRDDGGPDGRAEVLGPAAHRAAIERRADPREPVFLPVERQAVAELLGQHVREQRRRGQPARDQRGRRWRRHEHRRLVAAGAGVAVLRARDDQPDEPGPAPRQLAALVPVDPLGRALEDGIDELDPLLGEVEQPQVAPPRRLGRRRAASACRRRSRRAARRGAARPAAG